MTTVEEKYYKIDACDGCDQKRRVRRLPTSLPDGDGRTSAMIVCFDCWANEMGWRKSINRRLPKNQWRPTWHFYDPSPHGDDVVEFEYEPQAEAEKAAEVLIFDDLQMSACKVAFDDHGDDYAILNKDGDAVAFANDYQELTELVALWRKNPSTIPSFDKLIVEKDGKPIIEPFLSDKMAANPRLVLLWDRIGGAATFERYSIWMVYESGVTLWSCVDRSEGIQNAAKKALEHAKIVTDVSINRGGEEYVVVVMPNAGIVDRDYAMKIGRKILAENKRAFAERGRTK